MDSNPDIARAEMVIWAGIVEVGDGIQGDIIIHIRDVYTKPAIFQKWAGAKEMKS